MVEKDQIPKATTRKSPARRVLKKPFVAIDDPPYTYDETEFMLALDQYKRDNRRPFPTCSEVLLVLISLGYRKVAPKEQIDLSKTPQPRGRRRR